MKLIRRAYWSQCAPNLIQWSSMYLHFWAQLKQQRNESLRNPDPNLTMASAAICLSYKDTGLPSILPYVSAYICTSQRWRIPSSWSSMPVIFTPFPQIKLCPGVLEEILQTSSLVSVTAERKNSAVWFFPAWINENKCGKWNFSEQKFTHL